MASLCPWRRCGLLIRPAGWREGWKGATGSLLSPLCRDTWRVGNSVSTARVLNLPACDSSPRKTPGKRTKRTQRTLAADPDSPRTPPQASSAPPPPPRGLLLQFSFPAQTPLPPPAHRNWGAAAFSLLRPKADQPHGGPPSKAEGRSNCRISALLTHQTHGSLRDWL